VLAGIAGFFVLLLILLALYLWLAWTGVSAFLRGEVGRGPVTVPGAVLRIVLGLMLCFLTWRSLRHR
jgi:hypothetical protein